MSDNIIQLQEIVLEIRRKIFRMICKAGGGHIAPAFSIAELMTVLYFRILKIDKQNPSDPDRDRFILSKGHACAALYATLVQAGLASAEHLDLFCQQGGELGGHPDCGAIPGIEATTGSLGHGLGLAAGIALAGRMDQKDYRVYTIMGDGECQEGSVWEAALFAAHHGLDRLTAIIDYNKLQAIDPIKDVLGLEPFKEKWASFNWAVKECDGHDLAGLEKVLQQTPFEKGKPSLLIAHTIKGKGISFMENVPIWHYRVPVGEEMQTALKELGMESLEKE